MWACYYVERKYIYALNMYTAATRIFIDNATTAKAVVALSINLCKQ